MAGPPSTLRGVATRRRLLDAAIEEFAAHGIAGARVERIVAAARSNKAQLYGYFGSKDGLFDAVFQALLDEILTGVPIDAGDLADWAVRLYDEYLRRPELVRLATWTRLERRPAGRLISEADHQRMDEPKVAAIARAQAAGRVGAGDPYELMTLVIAMSLAWSPVSVVYAAEPAEPAETHARRRDLLRDCVRRAVAP